MANGTYIPSSLPFGYKKNQDGEIIIDEIQANYIHKIYTDFLNGRSTEEIAKDLSKQQKTTPVLHSYQWTVHAIARILKNETYTGNFLWQKSFRTSTLPRHYKINRGEKQKYLALHLFHCPCSFLDVDFVSHSVFTEFNSIFLISIISFFCSIFNLQFLCNCSLCHVYSGSYFPLK